MGPCAHGAEPREKCMREGQSGEAEDQGDSRVNQPQNAEHPDLAGIGRQNKLKAGHRRHLGRYWTVALRTNNLSLCQCSAASAAKHIASLPSNQEYATTAGNVPVARRTSTAAICAALLHIRAQLHPALLMTVIVEQVPSDVPACIVLKDQVEVFRLRPYRRAGRTCRPTPPEAGRLRRWDSFQRAGRPGGRWSRSRARWVRGTRLPGCRAAPAERLTVGGRAGITRRSAMTSCATGRW